MNLSHTAFSPVVTPGRRRQVRSAAIILAVLSLLGRPALAADSTETIWGGGTSSTWSAGVNWGADSSASGPPSSTISAEFTNASPTNQPTLAATGTAQGIWATGSSGNTTISGGSTDILTITGTGTLNSIANAGILLDGAVSGTPNNLTINAPVAISNSTSFIVNNAGTLTLDALNVNGKTLTLGAAMDGGGTIDLTGGTSANSGAITVNTTGAVNISGANLNTGLTTLTAGTLTITGTVAGSITAGGGTLNLNNTGAISTGLLNVNGTGTPTVTENATNAISGTTALTISNANAVVRLSQANSFSGNTTFTNGSLILGNNGSLGTSVVTTGGGTLSASTTLTGVANSFTDNSTMTIGGSNAITFSGTFTQNSGASRTLTISNSGGTTFSGGAFYLSSSATVSANLTINGAGPVTIGDVIANFNGSGVASGLFYGGSNTLTLTNQNTYTGVTQVFGGGTVILTNAGGNTLASSSSVVTGSLTTSGVLQLGNATNASNQTVASLTSSGTGASNAIVGGNASTSTLTINNTAANSYGGALGGSSANQNDLALVLAGSNTVTLSGANTFSGGVKLNSGALAINNASAIGSGTLAIAAGTTLDSTVSTGTTLSTNNAQTWAGGFTFAGTDSLNLGTGAVTMAAPLTVTVNAKTLTVGGAISGTTNGWLDITKAGTGTLALGESVTLPTAYTPNITGGTLELTGAITLAGNTAITSAAGTTLYLAGSVGDTNGTSTLVIGGAGAVALGANNTYGGNTTLNSGVLELGQSGSLNNNQLTINGGELSGIGTGPIGLNSNVVVTAADTATFGDSVNVGTVTLAPAGDGDTVTFGDGSTVVANTNLIIGSQATLATGSNNVTFDPASGKTIMLGGLTGSNGIIVEGAGIVLTDSGTTYNYSGSTTVTGGGTLRINASTSPGTLPGTITISGAGTLQLDNGGSGAAISNPINVLATSTLTVVTPNTGGNLYNGAYTLGSSGVGAGITLAASARGITIQNSTFTLGGTSTFTTSSVSGVNLTISDSIQDGGSGYGIVVTGASTGGFVILSGNNTFTGGLTINNGGIVELGNAGAMNSTTPNALTFGAGSTGQFEIDNHSVTISSLSSNATVGAPLVENGGTTTATTLTVSGTTNSTFGGMIEDGSTRSLALTKSGTNTLTLSGSNTYTGATTVSGGNLIIASTGSLGSSSAVSITGGTLTVNGTVAGTVGVSSGGTLSGSGGTIGALTVAGGGIINTVDGSALGTLNGTTLTLTSGGGNAALDLEIGSGQTADALDFSGAASLSNNFTVNVTALGGAGTGTYTILTANGGGLSTADFSAGSISGLTGDQMSFALSSNGDSLELIIGPAGGTTPAVAYFNGVGTDMNTSGDFDTDVSSVTAVSDVPGSTTDVYFSADRNKASNPNLSAALAVNSITFGATSSTGTSSGMTLSSTSSADTLTIEAGTTTNDTTGAGITVTSTGGSDTVSAPIILGASQNWNVASSGTLTQSGGITGTSGQTLTLNGPGSFNFSSGATGANFAGNTTVASGSLFITNSSGSALGTGTFTVNRGATFGGQGSATGMSSFALGSGGSGTTQVQVSSGGNNTASVLTLAASGASTINNANLTFNLSSTTLHQANELNLGSTPVSFQMGNTTLTLNVVGGSTIQANTSYVLIFDSAGFTGLTTNGGSDMGNSTNDIITGGLSIASSTFFSASINGVSPTGYYNGSYIYLTDNGDEIAVMVVPEPGTWAMMLGGLALLVLWQRRRRQNG